MKRGLLLIAVALALAVPASAGACSCAPLDAQAVKRADAAVVAKLESVRGGGEYGARFAYEVRHVAAGGGVRRGDRIVVHSFRGESACGLDEREGRKSGLLLERFQKDRWRASGCVQTSPKRLRELAAQAGERRGAAATGCA